MPDAYVGVEESSRSEADVFSPLEKLYNLPLYILRKLVLYSVITNLYLIDMVSQVIGFHFNWSVIEDEKWKWLSNIKLPRYGVIRKD